MDPLSLKYNSEFLWVTVVPQARSRAVSLKDENYSLIYPGGFSLPSIILGQAFLVNNFCPQY